jgi:hypothetical protein
MVRATVSSLDGSTGNNTGIGEDEANLGNSNLDASTSKTEAVLGEDETNLGNSNLDAPTGNSEDERKSDHMVMYEHSPRKPAPEMPELKGANLTWTPPTNAEKIQNVLNQLGPDPWQPGGCGILSAKRVEPERELHLDPLWRAHNLRVSPDRSSATIRGQRVGGFAVSSQVLARKPHGRWFEVIIEEVDNSCWISGLGIGVAECTSRDTVLAFARRKSRKQVLEGYAYELLPKSWLIGYDGRVKICGLDRNLQDWEMPQGTWRPAQLQQGDVVGLQVTCDGHMLLFVNEQLRCIVRDTGIPWKEQMCAVVDLDGCTRSIHLVGNNGKATTAVLKQWNEASKSQVLG